MSYVINNIECKPTLFNLEIDFVSNPVRDKGVA